MANITTEQLAQLKWKKSTSKLVGMGEISELNVDSIKLDVQDEDPTSIVCYFVIRYIDRSS